MARFGLGYDQPGYIAGIGHAGYNHRFGGDTWKVIDAQYPFGDPTLLVVLDLNDPVFVSQNLGNLRELPLCSHINCYAFSGKQEFQIDLSSKTVRLSWKESNQAEELESDLQYPNPLPEIKI